MGSFYLLHGAAVSDIQSEATRLKDLASQVVRKMQGQYPDFVLCIGDDVSDEHLFSSVYSFLADIEEGDSLIDSMRVFIATVGMKPSRAGFYLGDTKEVADLMSGLANLSPST